MNNEAGAGAGATEPKKKQGIKVSDVLGLMKIGYTRTPGSTNYNSEIGSVQEHYGLTDYEVKHLYKLKALKNAKTSVAEPINFFIVDEDEEKDEPTLTGNTTTSIEPEISKAKVKGINSTKVGAPGVSAEGEVIVVYPVAVEAEMPEVMGEDPVTSLTFGQEDLGKEIEPTGPFQ
jgi:hypothetical protein